MESIITPTNLCDRAKLRLRIAARFLRQAGHRFQNGDFYIRVLTAIRNLPTASQENLRGMVDWLEEYETTTCEFLGEISRSRASKNHKPKSGNKGASHPYASGI